MEERGFWLVSISDSSLTVSLNDNLGPSVDWFINDPESLITALDQSLSTLSQNIGLAVEEEPNQVAFVLPPSWSNESGKITSEKLKLLITASKKLDLKAIGFLSYDDALLEYATNQEESPSSFIVINFYNSHYSLSLIYLNKITVRFDRPISSPFDPQQIETALNELHGESALPPIIWVTGNYPSSYIDQINNYQWIGKKDQDIFLQLPEIKFFTQNELHQIYFSVINQQLNPNAPQTPDPVSLNTETPSLIEVSCQEMGFCPPQIEIPILTTPQEKDQIIIDPSPPIEPKPKKIFKFPKLHFGLPTIQPKIKIPRLKIPLLPLAFSPLLIIPLLLFYKVDVLLSLTPIEINKTFPIILDTTKETTADILKVTKKSIENTVSDSIPTTGTIIIGEKAKGEIIIFNKQDQTNKIPKGSILEDNNGHKFELIDIVQVASSSSDLNAGIITLGQTKTAISAVDIGPEYNINKDTNLTFKDFSSTIMVAKSIENFSGGVKEEVPAVSKADTQQLESQINEALKTQGQDKLKEELKNTAGVIIESIKLKQSRLEFNREIGEKADNLSSTINATISAFVLENNEKEKYLKTVLSSLPEFNQLEFNNQSVDLKFNLTKILDEQATGQIVIDGKFLPKLDTNNLVKQLLFRRKNTALKILKDVQAVYKIDINSNMPFLDNIIPLPSLVGNIKIKVQL